MPTHGTRIYIVVVLEREECRLHLVDLDTLHKNPHSTLLVLQAIVNFVYLTLEGARVLWQLAISIEQLDYFAVDGTPSLPLLRDNRDANRALQLSLVATPTMTMIYQSLVPTGSRQPTLPV